MNNKRFGIKGSIKHLDDIRVNNIRFSMDKVRKYPKNSKHNLPF